MQDFQNKKIILGISGGIAAYKTVYLARELTRLGATVQVVMTQAAQAFVTPLTMQALTGQEVRCDLLDPHAERAMGHIELARWADYLVIAPASANCIAKMAHGLADDLLSTLYLVSETPVLVCPAMNRSMWAHPATSSNIKTLADRGGVIVGPEEGSQACGEEGFGRMSEVDAIINALRLVDIHQLLRGQRVMITAGPTHEPIDPVRFIGNRSSGKMGYALAQAAVMAGAQVTLVSGPTALPVPQGVTYVRVDTASEMHGAVMQHLKPGTLFIGAAAVGDFHVSLVSEQKMKRQQQTGMTLSLTLNPDILASVVASGKATYSVGFAAETTDVIHYAQEKLNSKRVDMIIANQVGSGKGFDVDENEVVLLTQKQQQGLATNHKVRLAGQIIAAIAAEQS